MYTIAQRWGQGMSELVMTPLVALCNEDVDDQGNRRAPRLPTLRARALSLEAAMQRSWKPGLVMPWADRERRVRFQDLPRGAPEGNAERRHQGGGQLPVLVYAATGERWDPGRDWKAQYAKGVLELQDADAPWESQTCDAVMMRLIRHDKQAVATYRILRRAKKHNLIRLITWAAQGGKPQEFRVMAHIERALHGRVRGLRAARTRVKDRMIRGVSSMSVLKKVWRVAEVAIGDLPETITVQRVSERNIAEITRTDRAWQGRLSPYTRCECERFRRWMKLQWGIEEDPKEHRGHVWATMDWIFTEAGKDGDGREEAPSQGWLRRLQAPRADGTRVTVSAIQPTSPGLEDIATEVAKVTVMLARKEQERRGVRHNPATSARLRGYTEAVAGAWAEEAMRAEAATGERAEALCVKEVCRHLRVPWLVCGPLDKGRHRTRMVCPAMAWKELEEAADPYCTWGPWISTPQASEWTQGWKRAAEELNNRWKHCGWPEMPMVMQPAEARTAAKSKAPMEKFRLIVATNKTPTATHAKAGAAAAEFLVDLAGADWSGESRGVESVQQVTASLHRMNGAMQEACRRGRGFLAVSKYDFMAFFQEVGRDQVHKALGYWKEQTGKRHGKRLNTVTIDVSAKATSGRRHPRANQWRPGAKFLPNRPQYELTANKQAAEGTLRVPLRAIGALLDLDAQMLIAVGPRLARQERGLTIGSPWGGAGAKAWAGCRERTLQTQRARQPKKERCRFCGTPADYSQDFTMTGDQTAMTKGIRWVDDRWTVTVGCCRAAVWKERREEHIAYTGYTRETRQALTAMLPIAIEGDGWERSWRRTVDSVLAFLGGSMGQTEETATTLVGMDVTLYEAEMDMVTSIPGTDVVRRITEDTQLATRPTTKDTRLAAMEGKERCEQKDLTHPRLPTRELTGNGKRVRQLLTAEMIRFADMTTPRWERGKVVGKRLKEWWGKPWEALLREMLGAGWGCRVWRDALARVHMELGAERVPDKEHRARIIAALGYRALEVVCGSGEIPRLRAHSNNPPTGQRQTNQQPTSPTTANEPDAHEPDPAKGGGRGGTTGRDSGLEGARTQDGGQQRRYERRQPQPQLRRRRRPQQRQSQQRQRRLRRRPERRQGRHRRRRRRRRGGQRRRCGTEEVGKDPGHRLRPHRDQEDDCARNRRQSWEGGGNKRERQREGKARSPGKGGTECIVGGKGSNPGQSRGWTGRASSGRGKSSWYVPAPAPSDTALANTPVPVLLNRNRHQGEQGRVEKETTEEDAKNEAETSLRYGQRRPWRWADPKTIDRARMAPGVRLRGCHGGQQGGRCDAVQDAARPRNRRQGEQGRAGKETTEEDAKSEAETSLRDSQRRPWRWADPKIIDKARRAPGVRLRSCHGGQQGGRCNAVQGAARSQCATTTRRPYAGGLRHEDPRNGEHRRGRHDGMGADESPRPDERRDRPGEDFRTTAASTETADNPTNKKRRLQEGSQRQRCQQAYSINERAVTKISHRGAYLPRRGTTKAPCEDNEDAYGNDNNKPMTSTKLVRVGSCCSGVLVVQCKRVGGCCEGCAT